MLELIHFSKRFGQQRLWTDVNLSLPERGLVLLTGPSGSGKTTLLSCINQLEKYEGTMKVDGIDLTKLNAREKLQFRQHALGCVYQHGGLLQEATVGQLYSLMEQIKGPPRLPVIHQAWQALNQEFALQQKVATLSKGQQQRLAMILACFGDVKILLLDEPITGLDATNRYQVYEFINQLRKHLLVIMSIHLLEEAPLQVDVHLQFPLNANQKFFSQLKNQLAPSQTRLRLSPMWLWRFHLQHRKQIKFRWRLTVFQSFTLSLFGVTLALSFLLENEVLALSRTMLGGEYQWFQSERTPEIHLESALPSEIKALPLPLQTLVSESYDDAYFERLKPFHTFYFDFYGLPIPFQGFHLGLINTYRYMPWQEASRRLRYPLKEDEIMLGIQPLHLKQLATILQCFPVLEIVNEALQNKPLPFYVKMDQPLWGYEDESMFILKKVVLDAQPTWYHDSIDYPKTIYEQRLRLPSKGYEEYREQEPWYVNKTVQLRCRDHDTLLALWQNDPGWLAYHLERSSETTWQVYKTLPIRYLRPVWLPAKDPYHFHSAWGYHYYPDQRVSGFAQPMMIGSLQHWNEEYLTILNHLETPFQWLQVPPPEGMILNHVLGHPHMSVKYQPRFDIPPLALNEIFLSSALASFLNVDVGGIVQMASIAYEANLEWGFLSEWRTDQLVVSGLFQDDAYLIYHHPYWWEQWVMKITNVPSYELIPEAWISFTQDEVAFAGETKKPFQEIALQVHALQKGLSLFFLGGSMVLLFPTFTLFWYYLAHQLSEEKARMKILMGYGAGPILLQQWYGVRLAVMMLELIIPTLILFFSVDWGLKSQLYQTFTLQHAPQFPWQAFALLLALFGGFFLVMKQFMNHHIHRLIQKNNN